MIQELCDCFQEDKPDTWDSMHKKLLGCRRFLIFPPDVVWKILYCGKEIPFPRCLPSELWFLKGKGKGKRGISIGEEIKVGSSLEIQTPKRCRLSRGKQCISSPCPI